VASYTSTKDETVRLFKSDFFEFFTRVHWSVPLILYVPLMVFVFYQGLINPLSSVYSLVGFFLLGLFAWTLLEYLLHRLVFHFHVRGKLSEKIIYLFHGIHHAYPNDSWRLVMPPGVSIPLAFLFYFGFSALMPDYVFQPFFAGFGLGYLCYDMIHYSVHHLPLRSKVGQFLKSYHLRHHFQADNRGYGVSSPLWDIVFRTSPPSR